MPASTVRNLLVRGMLAGLVAGVIAFAFAFFVGEGPVDQLIALESTASAPQHVHGGDTAAAPAAPAAEEEEELVSRSMQSTAGLATGVLVYGVALGGIAALVYSFALGRIGRFSPRASAALVSAAAFTTVYLVPFLKYPATPPAVGNPDTIGKRTTLFFLMVLLSVLLGVAALILGRRLAPRLGNWNASVVAGLAFAAAVTVAFVFLPGNGDAVRETFPAALLWQFRVATLGIQAVLWAAFGLVFGHLAERLLAPRQAPAAPSAAAVPAA
ncbi:CbtA family protein [Kitasatospora sp. NPDC051853]|uniref:CbtA family protein n=1 Tax=Kitasatospora sp. NPDC051853 TaxID=3364058 RepID=UPI0037909CBC